MFALCITRTPRITITGVSPMSAPRHLEKSLRLGGATRRHVSLEGTNRVSTLIPMSLGVSARDSSALSHCQTRKVILPSSLMFHTVQLKNSEPEAKFRAHYIPATRDRATAKAFNLSPSLQPHHIMRAQSLEQAAIGGSDLYAKHNVIKWPMLPWVRGCHLLIGSEMETTARDRESEILCRASLEQGAGVCSGRDGTRHRAQPPYPRTGERGSREYHHAY